jgi:hypothetical protein
MFIGFGRVGMSMLIPPARFIPPMLIGPMPMEDWGRGEPRWTFAFIKDGFIDIPPPEAGDGDIPPRFMFMLKLGIPVPMVSLDMLLGKPGGPIMPLCWWA